MDLISVTDLNITWPTLHITTLGIIVLYNISYPLYDKMELLL